MLAAQATGNISQALMHLSSIQGNSQYRLFTPTVLAQVRETMIDSVNAAYDQRIYSVRKRLHNPSRQCQYPVHTDIFNRVGDG